MAPLEVRPMARADLRQLRDIFDEVIADGDSYAQDAPLTLEEFESNWCGRGGEQWVAADEERVLGGYTLRANHPGRAARVGTASYIVARAARGRGVGRALGEHSIVRARALGFSAMQFNLVISTNIPAVRLWQSLGFRTLARLPGAFEHARLGPVDALLMFRELRDDTIDAALGARTHAAVMRTFVDRGRAPTVVELTQMLAVPSDDVERALRRLHDDHGLVLHPGSTEIWIAHPFVASPTGTWVDAGDGRGWWAPCMWCALGIAVLAAPNAIIHARLGAEAQPARIALRDGSLVGDELFVHFALPVRNAWNNVAHWCATVLPFARREDVSPWCARHGVPCGDVVPVGKVLELARAWYGGYLRDDWRKWTLDEARAIFERVGLGGDTWSLPVGGGRF